MKPFPCPPLPSPLPFSSRSACMQHTHMFFGSQITKSSVYKNEITEAAVSAIQETIDKISAGLLPLEVDNSDPATLGMLRPTMPEEDRAVDLTLDAQAIARQIRFSDGSPGAPIELCGEKFRAFGAIADVAETVPLPNDVPPGTILGCRDGAVAVATGDGVVFISHLKCATPTVSSRGAIKVPAATALQDHSIPELPPLSLHYSSSSSAGRKWFLPPVDTYMDLWTQTTGKPARIHTHIMQHLHQLL